MEKYFKPTFEDIRVGYELEYHTWSMDEAGESELNYDRWEATILKPANVETFMKYGIKEGVRVPYLNKEKIENEKPWILLKDYPGISSYFHTLDDDYGKHWKLSLNPILHTIEIKYCWYDAEHKAQNHTNFIGSCPSINEFRTIMKFLNIE